jgi:hypothetical protein
MQLAHKRSEPADRVSWSSYAISRSANGIVAMSLTGVLVSFVRSGPASMAAGFAFAAAIAASGFTPRAAGLPATA